MSKLQQTEQSALKDKAKKIRLLICDVDGVLTDGSLFFGDDGEEYKAFNSLDGHGIKMLQESGVKVAIITGRTSNVVLHRMKNLSVTTIYQGQSDKMVGYQKLLEELNIQPEEIAYMGDDVVDLPVMIRVGLAVAVANAHEVVIQHADITTQHCGGQGAVREFCDFLIKAQGNYDKLMAKYLN
ncbi:MAG: 3-deoxy-manno-octulosonate-8-phosphatase KdsC [Pseudomonadota bacterium]